jgi:hypothetical protein
VWPASGVRPITRRSAVPLLRLLTESPTLAARACWLACQARAARNGRDSTLTQPVTTGRFISAPRLNMEELGVAGPSRNYSKSGDLVVVNGLTACTVFRGGCGGRLALGEAMAQLTPDSRAAQLTRRGPRRSARDHRVSGDPEHHRNRRQHPVSYLQHCSLLPRVLTRGRSRRCRSSFGSARCVCLPVIHSRRPTG